MDVAVVQVFLLLAVEFSLGQDPLPEGDMLVHLDKLSESEFRDETTGNPEVIFDEAWAVLPGKKRHIWVVFEIQIAPLGTYNIYAPDVEKVSRTEDSTRLKWGIEEEPPGCTVVLFLGIEDVADEQRDADVAEKQHEHRMAQMQNPDNRERLQAASSPHQRKAGGDVDAGRSNPGPPSSPDSV
ncbi:hypothetical protein B0H17DRAFT_1148258 [Mycena rosella]|uniref:Uncharacterized protein n=1 Tax=Mycena rosella TaxID=1033263 RepID=A0AAD7FVW9_MYCRO|nr:hypothetical protein B0H17DRAFT_1148258 [Mycena rosella]